MSVFGTKEWAKYNINCCFGCSNNCRYCYARANAIKYNKKTAENWNEETINENAVKKEYKKYDGTIMFPTTHDITPKNIDACLIVLKKLLKFNNNILIVSKPRLISIIKLCNELNDYKDNILFRFTIGSANNEILSLWEPFAPSFGERVSSLEYAFYNEFKTSLSCEPMLDGNIENVINIVEKYITDAIWLGKMNFATDRLKINKEEELIPYAEKLIKLQNNEFIMYLYSKYKDNKKIKWKESIKKIVGIEIPEEKGLDI